jgi:hypothetical protein
VLASGQKNERDKESELSTDEWGEVTKHKAELDQAFQQKEKAQVKLKQMQVKNTLLKQMRENEAMKKDRL